MKVLCIKSSKRKTVTEGCIYEVFGIHQSGQWGAPQFVIFNDKNEWKTYPTFLFEPYHE